MTIRECIDIVDNTKPNQYGDEDKVRWLSFLDGTIINDVLKTHEGYEGQYDDFTGYSVDNLGASLVVSAPYDRLYTAYLKMKIDEENGETARYNNSMMMYNTYLMEYKKWYNKTHMPLTKGRRRSQTSSEPSSPSQSLTKDSIVNALGYLPAKEGDFATPEYVKAYAQPKGAYLTEIPEEYITEEELEDKGYLTEADIGDIDIPTVDVDFYDVAIPLLLSEWVEGEDGRFTQTVAVEGLSEGCEPIILLSTVDALATVEELDAYGCLSDETIVEDGSMTFVATTKPSISFTVIAKGVSASANETAIADLTKLVAKYSSIESKITELEEENDKLNSDYYSLKDAIELTENTDLNDIREFGNYVCSAATSLTVTNHPLTLVSFVLKVERTGYDYVNVVKQTIKYNNMYEYYRIFTKGTWSEWEKIATSSDIITRYLDATISIAANGIYFVNYVVPSGYTPISVSTTHLWFISGLAHDGYIYVHNGDQIPYENESVQFRVTFIKNNLVSPL